MTHFSNKNSTCGDSDPGTIAEGIQLQQNGWLVRFGWLIPISVAIVVYRVVFSNFFTFDDFIWLNRARTLGQNWPQIFRLDVMYFDPLVHLLFWADFQVAGVDPRWYHCVDLAIHATNSMLIYCFARLLCFDERSAIYVGILFASSFAIANAVLWPSSRVDLLATLCSLGTLIQFLNYLRYQKRRSLFFSFMLFVLALGAKGTPIVIPIILLWLTIQENKSLRFAIQLAPFGVVIILYVVLLKLSMHQASLPLDKLGLNIHNVVIAFCALFIPEEVLVHLNLLVCAFLLLVMISAICVLTNTNVKLLRTGYCILTVSIMPVLITTNFNLITKNSDPYLLLSSPSHRLYLASVGVALFLGGFLRSAETSFQRFFSRFTSVAVSIFLVGVVLGNIFLVWERNQIWESAGDRMRDAFIGLLPYRQQVVEGAQIGLIYFPSSSAFLTPMIRVLFDLKEITHIKTVQLEMIADPVILRNADKSFLFILDSNGLVHDKSLLYRQLLLFNRAAIQNPYRPEFTNAYQVIASKLKEEIYSLPSNF